MVRNFARWAPRVAVALGLATAGCSAPTNDEQDGTVVETPEIEQPLTLSVDALDVRHGGLRIEATMIDGSADVAMWLGPSCEAQEVGHGIATRAGFVWSLSGAELSRAIECNLVVKAHGVDDGGARVVMVAPLEVGVALVEVSTDAVKLVRQVSTGTETMMTFTVPSRAGHLHIDGTVVGAEETDEEEEAPEGLFIRSFSVANTDLARSLLHHSRISLLGEHFLATVTVGNLAIDVAEPAEPEPEPAVEPAVDGSDESYDDGENEG